MIAKFLANVTGLSRGSKGKIEIRTLSDGDAHSYFFDTSTAAVAFGQQKRETHHVFFGVAVRATSGSKKENVEQVSSLWIDLDRKGRTRLSTLQKRIDNFPLRPSYVVATGGGLHAYWVLDEPLLSDDAEGALKSLQKSFSSDYVTDCTRIMRLPGTLNHKYKPPRPVEFVSSDEKIYPTRVITSVAKLDSRFLSLLNGEQHKFPSRSEKDFAIIATLIRKGADFNAIKWIFDNLPVGDRYIERGGEDYLVRTYTKAGEFIEVNQINEDDDDEDQRFLEFEDCYYIGQKRISTFVLDPIGVLEGREDSLICNVRSRGREWKNKVFPRSAFIKKDALQRHLKILSWQWLGTDQDVRELLVYLVDNLLLNGDVRSVSTSVIGRHDNYWVAPSLTFNGNGEDQNSYSYISVGREAPQVSYKLDVPDNEYRELLTQMIQIFPRLNRSDTIWPVFAWFLATPHKPLLEQSSIRFPILMLFGTRGSGKTSLVHKVFQRLVGYTKARGYDCDTSKFSRLALLGSTNAVPLSFNEFRESGRYGADVTRMIRMSYDVGYDLRGRPDQTTTSYPLIAPFTIDGEDIVSDPACLERLIPTNFRPTDIMPGTDYNKAFQETLELSLDKFMGRYIQFCILNGEKLLKDWNSYLERAQSLTSVTLPSRIVSNYAVLFFGLRTFQAMLNTFDLKFSVKTGHFLESLNFVFNTEMGRTHLIIDDFISEIINEVALAGGKAFAWRLEDDTFWFHLKSSYDWWRQGRQRRNEDIVGLAALKQQLKERKLTATSGSGQYAGEPKTKSQGKTSFWMHPIDTKLASEVLDTPYPVGAGQVILKVKGI